MTEKPGWCNLWWWWFTREEPNKIDKLGNSTKKDNKQVWWGIGYTLSEVEEILKKQRKQKK